MNDWEAFVQYNMQQMIATIHAAGNKVLPAMVMLFPHSPDKYGSLLVNQAAEASVKAKVSVALHLDHEQDYERVKYAASLPFDSIMVDMSHYELEENLRRTKNLTDYCNERGIAVEAEAGRIGGEDGLKDTRTLDIILTTHAVANRFIDISTCI